MNAVAVSLQGFFTDRLIRQRQASPHTVAAYRDTLKLLLSYAGPRTGKTPATLTFADLDADLISGFLDHLEHDRGNSIRTRNARLAAIHSFYRYASWDQPQDAATMARVLAIPPKRGTQTLIAYLSDPEVLAVLAAPDVATWTGRRDHALIAVAVQTGLRLSELTALTGADVHLGAGAHLSCLGKGRKHRATPLDTATVAILQEWITENVITATEPIFGTRARGRLSPDAVSARLTRHAATAVTTQPSLTGKKVTAHVLRHTCAMRLLHAGVDSAVIALWLGHESVATTTIYIHADLALKERALARTAPTGTAPGRFQPPDSLLAFLDQL